MDRNTETHFSELPNVEISRSKFKRPNNHKTTYKTGDLIPIYLDQDILPGDTIHMEMASVTRMLTPLYPTMDNAYMDVYWFFVPTRLIWTHFKEFWGENNTTYWEQPVEYEIPQIEFPSGGWTEGTIADYFGVPTKVGSTETISHLPFRAYCKIVNDWFRDENLKDPCFITMDETTVTGTNSGNYVINTELGAKPYKVAKYHDYFTSCLPSPQKGSDVKIPLGKLSPVITGDEHEAAGVLRFNVADGTDFKMSSTSYTALGVRGGGTGDNDKNVYLNTVNTSVSSGNPGGITPNNLWADLAEASAATINQLRQAFAIQRFFEAEARSGSRYIEFIKGIFGIESPDARLQRSEYLGGYRLPINITQVLQTSATDAVSPQGNTAAYSFTPDQHEVFTYSSTEHGILMGLACVRTDHTYQQGIDRAWLRKKKFDCYIPQFANLGEMPVYNSELYYQGNSTTDKEAFGYQEAWADYRFRRNYVTGLMRSNATGTLDSWHYADDYSSMPYLDGDWIDETDANVARTLTVTTGDQFISDFYFDATYVRPMPVYSVPGLIDHH